MWNIAFLRSKATDETLAEIAEVAKTFPASNLIQWGVCLAVYVTAAHGDLETTRKMTANGSLGFILTAQCAFSNCTRAYALNAVAYMFKACCEDAERAELEAAVASAECTTGSLWLAHCQIEHLHRGGSLGCKYEADLVREAIMYFIYK
jgi:hypothetical protein